VPREDLPSPVIDLYLPFALPACPFEAQVHAADAGEEGAEGWHSHSRPLLVLFNRYPHHSRPQLAVIPLRLTALAQPVVGSGIVAAPNEDSAG
jgi:hypothetical protein